MPLRAKPREFLPDWVNDFADPCAAGVLRTLYGTFALARESGAPDREDCRALIAEGWREIIEGITRRPARSRKLDALRAEAEVILRDAAGLTGRRDLDPICEHIGKGQRYMAWAEYCARDARRRSR